MRTLTTPESASDVLMGKARSAILALLFTHTDRAFNGREIARLTGVAHGQTPTELRRLAGIGLLAREQKGRAVYYRANPESPLFEEIRGLMVKTRGLADVLRTRLEPLADAIDAAFIYGSFARGEERAGSDVDVLLVGRVSFAEAAKALASAGPEIGREVNVTVFTPEELGEKVRAGHPFAREVIGRPKIMLMGDEDGLRSLGA